MFPEVSFYILLIPGLTAVAIFGLFARRSLSKKSDPKERLITRVRYSLWAAGSFYFYLWFLLPTTATLSTFGYPKSTADIARPDQVLHYLQWYNHDIVRLVDVVYFALFVGVVIVGGGIAEALREFSANTPAEADSRDKKSEQAEPSAIRPA
jgi:hypothetical protein